MNPIYLETYVRVLPMTMARCTELANGIKQAHELATLAVTLNTPAEPEKRGPGRPPKENRQ